MSGPEFHNERRPSWRVVRIMVAELERQRTTRGPLNTDGQVEIKGLVDLAHLASITEHALRTEFGT